MLTKEQWAQKAASLKIEGRAFIDGKYVPAISGKTFSKINPATMKSVGEIAACDSEDVDRAVAAARRAFKDGRWSGLPPKERKLRLVKFSELIMAHREELALLETLDAGKPIDNTYNDDIPGSANCIRWFGELIDKVYDEVAPTVRNVVAMIRRQPLGVVAAVVPWNFPLYMAAWKIGPVLAAGNSIIVKPAEQSPLTAIRVAQLAVEAGIPDGVLNVVPGFGETAGQALGLHRDVDAVTFTGSTEVGKYFMTYSGKSNLKRVSLECGGKSPNIIMADCPDLDRAVEASAWGIYYNAGEICSAGSRLLVQESIKDAFFEKFEAFARKLRVGDPLDPATQMGPVVDATQFERVLGYIEAGKTGGAKLRFGGKRVAGAEGCFIEPTMFENVTNSMKIAQEEIFGPVVSAITFKTLEEAIAIGNDTIYGLASAVWTSNLQTAFKATSELHSGVVWVNAYEAGDITAPFGGFKQSGFGRDKSVHAFDKYSDLKTIWISLA